MFHLFAFDGEFITTSPNFRWKDCRLFKSCFQKCLNMLLYMKYTIRGVTALLGAFSEKLLRNLADTFSLNHHIIYITEH